MHSGAGGGCVPIRRIASGKFPGNGPAVAGAVLLHAFALFFVPALLLGRSNWWGLALVPFALLSNMLWSLIHEAIHGHLFIHRQGNESAGRVLAILHGASFLPLRLGHYAHHKYSRTVRERAEIYDPSSSSQTGAALRYFLRILGGLYALEVLGTFSSVLPRTVLAVVARSLDREDSVAGPTLQSVLQPGALFAVRFDATAICALYFGSALLYGSSAWMLAVAVCVRGFLISLADNAYHYGTALDRPREALDLAAPRWLHRLLLEFTLHGTHHANPSLPWFELRRKFERSGAVYQGTWFKAVAAQLGGPIPLARLRADASREKACPSGDVP
jgi:fatty acid desaturase